MVGRSRRRGGTGWGMGQPALAARGMKTFSSRGDAAADDLTWITLGTGEVSFDWSVCDVHPRKLHRHWIQIPSECK